MDWLYLFLIKTAQAVDGVQLLEPLGGANGLGSANQPVKCIEDYITPAFNIFLGLAAVLAIVQFAYGGFLYMMSEAVTNKSEAKGKMTSAVWGLILLLACYIILKEINPTILTSSIFGTNC